MAKKLGILDVARHAGVSSATVSRVLSGQPVVSEEMHAKVATAIQDLGFRPNQIAQGLRRGRTTTVALLVGDIEQGVYASLTKEIQLALEKLGLDLLLYNLGHSQDRLAKILARADSMHLHGIVIAASDMLNGTNIQLLSSKIREQQLPVFAIGLSLQEHGIPSIIYDDREAISRSVDYLLAAYGGPVAYLGRIGGSAAGTERFAGYRSSLETAGMTVDPGLVWDAAFRYTAGFESVKRALEAGAVFRSIQAGSDELALGAIAAIHAHKLRIPDDIAIVGIGNVESSAYFVPPLTTHGAFPEKIAGTLLDRLEAREAKRETPLLTKLSRPFIRRVSA
jgi:DNA-binding LacI/PurR family transcriptional regulator